MSQANVEIVRRLYPGSFDLVSAFTDPEGFESLRGMVEEVMEPGFETVTVPGQVPLTGIRSDNPSRPTMHGLDGFVAAFRDWLTAWQSWMITATDFIDAGEDQVLVLLAVRAVSKTHGVEMPIEGANLFTLRNGSICRVELFFDQAEARVAAGLAG